jgi:putative endonuclease
MRPGCFVYILGCRGKDRTLTYVGWTNDLDRRLAQHNAGTGARSTRGRSWVLLYSERLETKSDAMHREWYLKRDRAFRKRLALGMGVKGKTRPRALPAPSPRLRGEGWGEGASTQARTCGKAPSPGALRAPTSP